MTEKTPAGLDADGFPTLDLGEQPKHPLISLADQLRATWQRCRARRRLILAGAMLLEMMERGPGTKEAVLE